MLLTPEKLLRNFLNASTIDPKYLTGVRPQQLRLLMRELKEFTCNQMVCSLRKILLLVKGKQK